MVDDADDVTADDEDLPELSPEQEEIWHEALLRAQETQGRAKLLHYFDEIRKTPEFQGKIQDWRKRYKIPENGYAEEESGVYPPDQWPYRHTKMQRQLEREIEQVCTQYGLHLIHWTPPIIGVLFHNQSTAAYSDDYDLCMLSDLKNEADEPFIQEIQDADNRLFPLAIRFSPFASQRDIVDYVQKNALMIRHLQDFYAKELRANSGIGKVRKKKESVQLRNAFIYEHRDRPGKEITRLVHEKFGELLDYGYIGKIISMEKKKRKEV